MSAKRRDPMRQCIGCGEQKSKREMIRVIRTPEGNYELDATGRKNGRGAYLCRCAECLEKAIRYKGLEKSFHAAIPSEVYDSLREELAKLDEE